MLNHSKVRRKTKPTRDSKGRFTKPYEFVTYGITLGDGPDLKVNDNSSEPYTGLTSGYIAVAEKDKETYLERISKFMNKNSKGYGDIVWPSTRITVNNSNLPFFKVLAVLSIITSTAVALMNNWQFTILVQRFENLKWLLTGYHPGIH
jgi:hypothetical protein